MIILESDWNEAAGLEHPEAPEGGETTASAAENVPPRSVFADTGAIRPLTICARAAMSTSLCTATMPLQSHPFALIAYHH